MSLRVGMVIFPENNPSFKWVVFAKLLDLLRCFHEKWIKNHTETVYLEFFMPNVSCSWWKFKRCNGFFLNIFCSRNKTRQFFEARWRLTEIFSYDENAGSEQIYPLLDDVESADEDDIDNLMNYSDAEFIA